MKVKSILSSPACETSHHFFLSFFFPRCDQFDPFHVFEVRAPICLLLLRHRHGDELPTNFQSCMHTTWKRVFMWKGYSRYNIIAVRSWRWLSWTGGMWQKAKPLTWVSSWSFPNHVVFKLLLFNLEDKPVGSLFQSTPQIPMSFSKCLEPQMERKKLLISRTASIPSGMRPSSSMWMLFNMRDIWVSSVGMRMSAMV